MPQRPIILIIYALYLGTLIFVLPIYTFLRSPIPILNLGELFQAIPILAYLTATLMALNIPLLLRASPYLKFTIPTLLIFFNLNGFFCPNNVTLNQQCVSLLTMLGFSLTFVPLFKFRDLIKKPQMRWWLRSQRKLANLPITLVPYVGINEQKANSFNVSKTGVFLQIPDIKKFKVGDYVTLNIKISDLNTIKCESEIVRVCTEKPDTPQGVALKFKNTNTHFKKSLYSFVENKVSGF